MTINTRDAGNTSKHFSRSSPINHDKRIRNGVNSLAVTRQPRRAVKVRSKRRFRVDFAIRTRSGIWVFLNRIFRDDSPGAGFAKSRV